MSQKNSMFLLQLTFIASVATAQIHFPDERNRPTAQSPGRTPVHVPNAKVESLVSDLTTIDRKPAAHNSQESSESIIQRGFTKLALDINRVVPTTSPHLANANSLVYGPLTITGVLELMMLASVGPTFNELANVLGLSSGVDIQNNPIGIHEHFARLAVKLHKSNGIEYGEQLKYALAIFVQQSYPIRPAYQQFSNQLYGTEVVNLDFRGNPLMAQTYINDWVSNRTNAKIPTLLNDFPPPNTRAIVAGVFYFKAAWEFPFFDGHTKWRPFFVNGRKKPSDRMAEMMANGGEFPYYKDNSLGVEIMGFPYKGKRSSMYVIIPRDSNVEKLRQLESTLTVADVEHLVNSTTYTEAVVLFPKMKLENTIDLKPALQTLGVNTLFNPYEANLALLSPGLDQKHYAPVEAPFVSPLANPAPSNSNHRSPQSQSSSSRVPSPSRVPPNSQVPSLTRPPTPYRVQQPTAAPGPSRVTTPRRGTQSHQASSTNQGSSHSSGNRGSSYPSTNEDDSYPSVNPEYPYRSSGQFHTERLVFPRFGTQVHCIPFYDYTTNSTVCEEIVPSPQGDRFRRAARVDKASPLETLEGVRQQVNTNPRLHNPGIYADQVIHKVYIDITESGTEAAAATGISLNRSGGRVTFRVDIPFLFFIYSEETKLIMFWGSVKSPTPTIATPST